MKTRSTLFACLSLVALASNGQTLDEATNGLIPMPSFVQYIGAGVDPGAPGIDQVWDMTGLVPFPIGTATTDFTPEDGSDPDYPGATVRETWMGDVTSFYRAYYRQASDTLFYIGTLATGGELLTSDHEALITFPCSFGSTWEDDFQFYDPSLLLDISGTVIGEADGKGTLLMPYGEVSDVLRVKLIENMVILDQGVPTDVTAKHYNFYRAGVRGPILSIYDPNSIPRPILGVEGPISKWVPQDIALGVPNLPNVTTDLDLVPNPATSSTSVLFGARENMTLELIDPMGRLVVQRSIKVNAPSMRREQLDLHGLAAGRYAVRVRNTKGIGGTRFLIVE